MLLAFCLIAVSALDIALRTAESLSANRYIHDNKSYRDKSFSSFITDFHNTTVIPGSLKVMCNTPESKVYCGITSK